MKINVGDKVKFLNDVGGGTVTKFIDKKNILVLNEYNFEVPVAISEVIISHEENSYTQVSETVEQEDSTPSEPLEKENIFYPETEVVDDNNDVKVYFAFVPTEADNIVNSDFDTYLINDSNYHIMYNYITNKEGQHFGTDAGVLEANTKLSLDSFKREELNDLPEFIFQFIIYKKGSCDVYSPIQQSITVKPTKFYKENSFKENDFFEENSLIFNLLDKSPMQDELDKLSQKDFKNIIREKESGNKRPRIATKRENKIAAAAITEVDLHINALIDNNKGMSNSEMLEIQLNEFEKKLDEAIKNKIKKIVFIHGVGNGVLKMKLRHELSTKHKKLKFQDASFKEYGYGATMVFIR
ncbi:MAG: DUF2027 domain-containing protein [Bacteroidales bacterium]|nr:DUF2027 domain-containing protein [Bacteroidales bacterium]